MDNAFPYGLVHAVIEMDGFHFEWGVQEPFGPSLIFPRFAVGPFLARVLVKRHLWSPAVGSSFPNSVAHGNISVVIACRNEW